MTVFDDALQKRFDEAPLITAIEVTSNDTLLIRDLETGQVMRVPVSVFYSALGSAFASLVDGKVPASQLPSYVDDVLEYANFAALPATGETGKIYVTLDNNLTYRWSSSAYVEISASLALGKTSSTAYRGDRGKSAYDHSQTTGNPHGTTKSDLGLGNVDNTSDVNKPVSTAQAAAIAAKEPTISAGTAAQYWRGDKTWQSLNQASVEGLKTNQTPIFSGVDLRSGGVDNTAGPVDIATPSDFGGIVTITGRQGGVGKSTMIYAYSNSGGTLAISLLGSSVIGSNPITSVSVSGSNIRLTCYAANTYINWGFGKTPIT